MSLKSLKSRGFILLSTIVLIVSIFSVLSTYSILSMYKRQQRINLQLAQEVNSIEVQSLHCLLNDHCPLGNSFELYESHINIHQEGQSATILVTGKHNFLIDCSFDVEKNRLITYTYNANQ